MPLRFSPSFVSALKVGRVRLRSRSLITAYNLPSTPHYSYPLWSKSDEPGSTRWRWASSMSPSGHTVSSALEGNSPKARTA